MSKARMIGSAAAEQQARLLDAAIEAAANAIFLTDASGVILWANRAFSEITGWPREAAIGARPSILKSGRHAPALYDGLWATIRAGHAWHGEIINARRDGTPYVARQTITPLAGEDGVVTHFIAIQEDITRQREAERRAEILDARDPLTGMANRAALVAAIGGGGCAGLVLLDIDGFRDINDARGHGAGDAILREVARRLAAASPPGSEIFRLGGDEFAVLVPSEAPPAPLSVAAAAIAAVFDEPFRAGAETLRLSASVGVAETHTGGGTADLMREAEVAMHRAARGGGGLVCFYDAAADAAMRRRIAVQSALRKALDAPDGGGISVAFQPQIRLSDGAVDGLESLLRWRHPDLGDVPPAEFVAAAEECGLIGRLDLAAARAAFREMAAWIAAGHAPPRISINLSAAGFRGPADAEALLDAARAADLPANAIQAELTESVLTTGADGVREALARLRDAGASVAIDDFGTGYASMAYLMELPADELKIDRSLVSAIGRSERHDAVVRAVIAIARELGMRTVAEGVETEDQAAFLRESGCDIAQGWLYSRALPSEQVPSFAAARR